MVHPPRMPYVRLLFFSILVLGSLACTVSGLIEGNSPIGDLDKSVTIMLPGEGAEVDAGPVYFEILLTGSDPNSISWSSSLDGQLGRVGYDRYDQRGFTYFFSPGQHTVTVTVDFGQAEEPERFLSDTVSIKVLPIDEDGPTDAVGADSDEEGADDADDEAAEPPTGNESDPCAATAALRSTTEILLEETNEYGTRICRYNLVITNESVEPVWYYVYMRIEDGFQGTADAYWSGNFPIAPEDSTEVFAQVAVYVDEDASGPSLMMPVRLAGVSGAEACAERRMDAPFLERHAVPLPVPAPCQLAE